jgi:hypothetical protein
VAARFDRFGDEPVVQFQVCRHALHLTPTHGNVSNAKGNPGAREAREPRKTVSLEDPLCFLRISVVSKG